MPTPTALIRTVLAALATSTLLALSPLARAQAVDDAIEEAMATDAPPLALPAAPSADLPAGVPTAIPTPPASLWTRLRAGFRIDDISTPLVQSQEDWFAARPEYIRRVVERSRRYLYFIVEKVESRGMPTEIALLPIIESAYNPVAYSRAHASGIWQFIPSTGKHYGLNQDFWYDGRRDVLAATDAALDYLEKLYAQFGSWELALAAYNWGEGAVERAINRNAAKGLPTNYLSLTMPDETRWYVPKLQAVKNIIANPERYGLTLPEVANEPYFAVVTTTRPMDVKLAARFAEVPMEEFLSLNAGHMRPVIRATGSQSLLVPVDKVDRFHANLASHDQPFLSWQVHTVQKGEQPDGIARRYGTSLATLKEVNGNRKFTPGAAVLVPAKAGTTVAHLPDLPALPVKVAKAPPPPKTKGVKVAQTGKPRAVKVAASGTRKSAPNRAIKARTAAKPAPVRTKSAPQKKIVVAQDTKR